jgi:hypothetical protein
MEFPITVSAALRQGALDGPPTPEQDELIWKLAEDAMDAYVRGDFTEAQAFQALLAWGGTAGELGWASLARSLPPPLRGPAAYVFGLRFRRLGKHAEADRLLRVAAADAPAGSPLARLARAERGRPAAGGGH